MARILAGTVMFWMLCWTFPANAATNQATDPGGGSIVLNPSGFLTVNSAPMILDPANSGVTASPAVVQANGVAFSTITISPKDSAGNLLLPGQTVTLRATFDQIVWTPIPVTDLGNGMYTGNFSSALPGIALFEAAVNGVTLANRPQVIFTTGLVLKINKSANKNSGSIGDVITYQVEIRNTIAQPVPSVTLNDKIPSNFKYLRGSVRLNGQKIADPPGRQTLGFALGTVPGFVDLNGNGTADSNEPGYLLLSYQLVIGSGASPGDYANTAQAVDFAPISNASQAKIQVVSDPLFDLGTLIGKVFFDKNQNGWQDEGEEGVPGAMVALDDGSYVITDANGLFHFPAVKPGERLLKINRASLPPGTRITTEESRIIQVTRGLISKVNFGIVYSRDAEQIGSPGKEGVSITPGLEQNPVEVNGNMEGIKVLVNGTKVDLPLSEVQLGVEEIQEIVEIKEDHLSKPLFFSTSVDKPDEVLSWRLEIFDPKGTAFQEMSGKGAPPDKISWNGKGKEGTLLEGGEIYQYQFSVQYLDGGLNTSSKRLFGVNKTSAIALNLTGSAFDQGSAKINKKTAALLHRLAETLKKYPAEKITIEGHTDNTGTDEMNLLLSKKRAEEAMNDLVKNEGIAADRFILKGYGRSRPIASNLFPEGREMNRRVEIKGEVKEVEEAKILNRFRSEPRILINGENVRVSPDGRFSAEIKQEIDRLNLEITNRQGIITEATLLLPAVEIIEPSGKVELVYGDRREKFSVISPPAERKIGPQDTVVSYRLKGKTDPHNQVWIDGQPVPVSGEGYFESEVSLNMGENLIGIEVTNLRKVSRIMNVRMVLSDKDENGRWLLAEKPVPRLSLLLPPKGSPLSQKRLPVQGTTEPGNRVTVNGKEIPTEKNGAFSATVEFPEGKSRLIVEVTDAEGYTGKIEREVEVKSEPFFLMALADGEFGQISSSGNLEGAGASASQTFYEKGRLAYYLKGMIQGKYLLTSAFDTGKQSFNRMFQDLDKKETDRFFTNLDPDKFYPVYGDASTLVYDAQSQGKFFLALDGEDLHILVGNFQTGLEDTELAAYNRTLYGGRAEYRSLSRTQYGDPDTHIVLFGAEVRLVHAQNTFRATGGSLYYLSTRNIMMGSEKIRLEVRDKDTGLILAKMDQTRDGSYSIKYDEGRILFNQPVSSVIDNDLLIHQQVLHGHPVFIVVDFEYETESLEKQASGGRVRQQISDHLAVGGTYIQDSGGTADYQLKEADAEVRLGEGTRITGEVARSEGKNSSNLISDDGGISFNEVSMPAGGRGSAYKIAGTADLSEWFWEKNRLVTEAYYKRLSPDFYSNGTLLEQGTLKYGGGIRYQLTRFDQLQVRYDLQEVIPGGALPGGTFPAFPQTGANRVTLEELHLSHLQGPFFLAGAFENRVIDQPSGTIQNETVAARFGWTVTDRLSTTLDHQWTLQGQADQQTSLGIRYGITDSISSLGQFTHGEHGDGILAGATASLGPRSRIYLNEKFTRQDGQDPLWGSVVGSDYQANDHLRLYTEYELQTAGVVQNRALWGLDQRWLHLNPLKLDFHYEQSYLSGSGTYLRRDTSSIGLHYDSIEGHRLADRLEVRLENGSVQRIQWLTTHYGEYKIRNGLTLMAKFNYSITKNETTDQIEARFTEAGTGMAYRPVYFDRLNLLARYTRLSQEKTDPTGWSLRTTTDIASVEGIFDATRLVQWAEKIAIKLKEEILDPLPPAQTETTLWINRINYHLTSAWDFGLEYRILRQVQANDQLEGFLIEVDREIGEHLRLGGGYNFSRFSDNEFSDNNYDTQGWFIRVQGKY